jgi:PDZ domain-containing protein
VPRSRAARLAALGAGLLVVALALLVFLPSNTYIFLPDRAHPVASIVHVQGERAVANGGGIYFVDIFVRKATWLERLWPGIHEGAELVPASELIPKGTSEKQRQRFDARAMTRSQEIAAAVAERAAGLHVLARPTGVLVDEVAGDAPAAGKLLPTDVIVSADGRQVRTPSMLRRVVGALRPGAVVHLVVRRGDTEKRVAVRTIGGTGGRTLIGIVVDEAATVKLPRNVTINSGSVGGPSAGLAFALEILEQLGRDVDHGRRIAVTGALELDGTVAPIGGVRQKTIGVRKSGIHVFVVPAGENASEARRYAHGVRILPVRNFQQALHALATLPASFK